MAAWHESSLDRGRGNRAGAAAAADKGCPAAIGKAACYGVLRPLSSEPAPVPSGSTAGWVPRAQMTRRLARYFAEVMT